ncbi:iActA-like proline repeat-containing protein [Borealpox virus]|nr:iActA-like proline repeat-containing protein [Alaskapox virus]
MEGSKRRHDGKRAQLEEHQHPRAPPSYEEIAKYGHSLHVKRFTNEEVCLKNNYPRIIAYDPQPK